MVWKIFARCVHTGLTVPMPEDQHPFNITDEDEARRIGIDFAVQKSVETGSGWVYHIEPESKN